MKIDLTLNHKNEKGVFIGPYRVGDEVNSVRFEGVGKITHCMGYSKGGYACYIYGIQLPIAGAWFCLPEVDLIPADANETP